VVTKVAVLAVVGTAVALSSGAASAQDAAKGEQVFKQCMTCHRIGPEAKNLVGPVLTGVIGRQSGTAPGFAYSALNKAASTKMTFHLADEQQRKDVIAYINKFSDNK
jgi:cytochrome c